MRRRAIVVLARLVVPACLVLASACRAAQTAPVSLAGTTGDPAWARFDPPATDAVGPASVGSNQPGAALALVSGRQPADAAAVVAAALPIAAAALGNGPTEHVHLEGIDWPGPAAAVVTVLSLRVTPAGVHVRRAAVMVSLLDGVPVGAGPALLLPTMDTAEPPVAALATSPIDDEATWGAAQAALTAAGFTDVRLLRLESAIEAWPVIATFRAGGREGRGADLVAWLRRDGARLVVAGLPGRPDPTNPAGPPATPAPEGAAESEDPS